MGQKDGPAFLQGECAGSRTAKEMVSAHIIGVDIDNGTPLNEVRALVQAKGLACALYTTHSHGRDTTTVRADDWARFQNVNPNASPAAFLISKKRYRPEVCVGATVSDPTMTPDGRMVTFTHAPMDKCRLVFPLAKPWLLSEFQIQEGGIKAWSRAYAAFCDWLGVAWDRSCVDISRLFYAPRHADGAPFHAELIEGDAVDIFAIQPAEGDGNPYLTAAKDMGATDNEPDDTRRVLLRWAGAGFADAFLIGSLLDELAPDRLRPEADRDGKRHVECPFEHEHTTPGGEGTFVMDAGDSDNGGFVVKCMHNACADRDRLDHVAQMIRDGWFTLADMADERWYLDIDGLDFSELPSILSGESGGAAKVSALAKQADTVTIVEGGSLSVEEGRALLAKAVEDKASPAELAVLCNTLVEQVKGTGKAVWNRELKEMRAKVRKPERSAESKDDGRTTIMVDENFRAMSDKTMERLAEANSPERLFKFNNRLSRVVRLDNDQIGIQELTTNTLRRDLSQVTRWLHVTENGAREVAPPLEVVYDVLAAPS